MRAARSWRNKRDRERLNRAQADIKQVLASVPAAEIPIRVSKEQRVINDWIEYFSTVANKEPLLGKIKDAAIKFARQHEGNKPNITQIASKLNEFNASNNPRVARVTMNIRRERKGATRAIRVDDETLLRVLRVAAAELAKELGRPPNISEAARSPHLASEIKLFRNSNNPQKLLMERLKKYIRKQPGMRRSYSAANQAYDNLVRSLGIQKHSGYRRIGPQAGGAEIEKALLYMP